MLTVALGLLFVGNALGNDDVEVSRCASDSMELQCQSDNVGLLQTQVAATTDSDMPSTIEDKKMELKDMKERLEAEVSGIVSDQKKADERLKAKKMELKDMKERLEAEASGIMSNDQKKADEQLRAEVEPKDMSNHGAPSQGEHVKEKEQVTAPPHADDFIGKYRKKIKLCVVLLAAVYLLYAAYQAFCFLYDFHLVPGLRGFRVRAKLHGITANQTTPRGTEITVHKSDQAWCEELGLCNAEFGQTQWLNQSDVDPVESHVRHSLDYEVEDTCAFRVKSLDKATLEISPEEQRVKSVQKNCLERERYVTVGFMEMFRGQLWSSKPGGYPGPAFKTKDQFTECTRPGCWPFPVEGTEDDVSEVSSAVMVGHLRNFIWNNNADGSRNATLIMVFLGCITWPIHYFAGQMVGVIAAPTVHQEKWTLFGWSILDKGTLCPVEMFMLLVAAVLLLEVLRSYVSYRFWTVVPKYGVLREFQSFFGRRCMQILMTQTGAKDDLSLQNPHVDRYRSSPGVCQAMANYCCEAVVLNLWGKSFNNTQAITTVLMSLLMMIFVMFTSTTGINRTGDEHSYLLNFKENFVSYGAYLSMFILLSFSMFGLNLLCRLKEAEDMWGVATKLKLNMFSLQQELMVRMFRAGKSRKGSAPTANDQEVLDDACSAWHDACRVYGNRDFHTWFGTWIITEESNHMLGSVSLAMSTVVLGIEVLQGNLALQNFVMITGALRSMNGALSQALNYYFSLPEGYVCLLYLVQVCNMGEAQAFPIKRASVMTPPAI